ncbi:MAG TPA: Ig-like domain-containing protein, partial [Bacteroidota bacterium]|nr:Ig-like domain-containing protein [Bacteroidota bacterium]
MRRSSRFIFLLVLLSVASLLAQPTGLRVVIGTPQGATSSIDQTFRIIAAFSEPMSALTVVPEGAGTGPLVLAPNVKGVYRWLGTTTLAFTPADTLPYSTRFTATVPRGTRAISGALLKAPYVWSFETPRPIIVRTQPASGESHVEPDHVITLTFNQSVDLKTIGRWISLEERATVSSAPRYPSYTLRAPTDEELTGESGRRTRANDHQAPTREERSRMERDRMRTVVVVPSTPFQKGSSIRVVCKSGLQAKEGPLGMTSEFVSTFSIYGDLTFTGVTSENHFHPAYPVRLEFSNPVSIAELARHISLTPEAKIRESIEDEYASSEHYVSFDLRPETQYTGVITSGLKDRFGNVLSKDAAFSFRTSSYPPSVSMTTGPALLEAYEAHKIPVVTLNCDSIGLRMGMLEPDQVIPLLTQTDFWSNDEWNSKALKRALSGHSIDRIWKFPASVRNKSVVRPIEIDEILGGAKNKGIAFVQLKQFDKENPRILKTIVQVTELGVTAKFSPESILIWATRLIDASAVALAEIELRTDSNRVVWRGRTDRDGTAKAPGWGALGIQPVREYYGQNEEYESTRPPRLWVFVKYQGDCAFTSSQWNEGIEPYSFNIEADWNPQPEKY